MAKSLPLLGDNYAQVGIAIVSGYELSVVSCSLSNPRRMHEGYSSHFMCVCLSVYYHTSCYIPLLYISNEVL